MIIRTDIDKKVIRVFRKTIMVLEIDHKEFTKDFVDHLGRILGCEEHRVESVKRRLKYFRNFNNIRTERVKIDKGCNIITPFKMNGGRRFTVSYWNSLYGEDYSIFTIRQRGGNLSMFMKVGDRYISEDKASEVVGYFGMVIKENKMGW